MITDIVIILIALVVWAIDYVMLVFIMDYVDCYEQVDR